MMIPRIRDEYVQRRVKHESIQIVQCRSCCLAGITTVRLCPSTGDGGDNPCGDRYLADTIVVCISNIQVT